MWTQLFLIVGGWVAVEVATHKLQTHMVAKQAREVADRLGKPMLNYGCGATSYGDVNADVEPREVRNFMLINPIPDSLPFPNGFFGSVICSHVLEHVPDPDFLIQELSRVADEVFIITPQPMFLGTWLAPGHRWVFYPDGRRIKIKDYEGVRS